MLCPYAKTIDRAIEIKVGHGNPTEEAAMPCPYKIASSKSENRCIIFF